MKIEANINEKQKFKITYETIAKDFGVPIYPNLLIIENDKLIHRVHTLRAGEPTYDDYIIGDASEDDKLFVAFVKRWFELRNPELKPFKNTDKFGTLLEEIEKARAIVDAEIDPIVEKALKGFKNYE